MNVLKSLETTISSLLEGAFGRMFRSEVRPMELARKLAREMDEHRTSSVSRVYAPNEFAVWLSPADRARYEGVEDEVIDELCAYLLEHARREELILASRPVISIHTDEDLALGEFGIRAEPIRAHHSEERPAGRKAPAAAPEGESGGETMIYSTSARLRGALEESRGVRPSPPALLLVAGRRVSIPSAGATIGRSRACEIVLEDAGVSRRHADIRPGPEGWLLSDLGSTNGVAVNGEHVGTAQLMHPGDRIQVGSTELVFELG